LSGIEVTESQLFKDNMHSFAVCYGLAAQQLGISSLKTNLIPREVVIDRIIREKKPWMLAAAAALLLGITVQFAGVTSAYNSVATDAYQRASDRAQSVQGTASNLKSQTSQAVSAFRNVDEIGRNLTSNVEGRITWLELLRALNAALPQAQPGAGETIIRPATSANFARQQRVYITSIEAISVDSLSGWFEPLKADNRYFPDDAELRVSAATGSDGSMSDAAPSSNGSEEGENRTGEPRPQRRLTETERFELVTGPSGTGPAKIVQITGYHYHNPVDRDEFAEDGGEAFLRKTLLYNLKFGTVELQPTLEEQQAGIQTKTVTMRDLGISFPVLLYPGIDVEERIFNPDLPSPLPPNVVVDPVFLGGSAGGIRQTPATAAQGQVFLSQIANNMRIREPILTVRRFDFVIQFAWEETPPSVRRQNVETAGTTAAGETY
jgi:type IV pilus assembly protein PilM